MALTLDLDIRQTENGRSVLHFPFMSVSDIHWGTKYSRAKRLCQMLEHTKTDKLALIGDIIDGYALSSKNEWNFPHWHRQGMAHILRKTDRGTDTTYISGNHEDTIRGKIIGEYHVGRKKIDRHHRKLSGKEIYGVKIEDDIEYNDPMGRNFLLVHGDKYDGKSVGRFYKIGDAAYTALYEIDSTVHSLAPTFSRHAVTCLLVPLIEHFSIAAWGKRMVKHVINDLMEARKNMALELDTLGHDGVVYGHSHMAGFHKTVLNKMMVNDGCCTEHVQSLVHDKHGHLGIVTWHKDKMDIEMEDGNKYTQPFKDLGLEEEFNRDPTEYDDVYTEKADRLLRLIYRQWSPKDRSEEKEEIKNKERLIAAFNESTANGHKPSEEEILFHRRTVVALAEQRTAFLKLPIPRRSEEVRVMSVQKFG